MMETMPPQARNRVHQTSDERACHGSFPQCAAYYMYCRCSVEAGQPVHFACRCSHYELRRRRRSVSEFRRFLRGLCFPNQTDGCALQSCSRCSTSVLECRCRSPLCGVCHGREDYLRRVQGSCSGERPSVLEPHSPLRVKCDHQGHGGMYSFRVSVRSDL